MVTSHQSDRYWTIKSAKTRPRPHPALSSRGVKCSVSGVGECGPLIGQPATNTRLLLAAERLSAAQAVTGLRAGRPEYSDTVSPRPGPADTGQYWPLIGHTGHKPGLWLADGETRPCDQTQTPRLRFRPLTAWGAGQLRGVSTFLIRRVWSHVINRTQSLTLHPLVPKLLTRPHLCLCEASLEAVLAMLTCQGCDRTFYP